MLKWSDRLYCSADITDPQPIKERIDTGVYSDGVFLITVSANDNEQLDIIRSFELKKKVIENRCGLILGMTRTRTDSFQVVADMANEVLDKTGGCDIRSYFENMDKGAC